MIVKICGFIIMILIALLCALPIIYGVLLLGSNIYEHIKHSRRRPMLNQLEKGDYVYMVKKDRIVKLQVETVNYQFGKDNKLIHASFYLKQAFCEPWGETEIINLHPNTNNKTFEYVNKYGHSLYTIKSLAKAKYNLINSAQNKEIEKFKTVQYSEIIESINKSIEALEKFKNNIYNKNDRNTR